MFKLHVHIWPKFGLKQPAIFLECTIKKIKKMWKNSQELHLFDLNMQ